MKSSGQQSKKHPVLEYIFKKYFNPKKPQKIISFHLSDISDGYRACGKREPASISNTILDLCRQDRGIDSRVPKSISKLGYDLRKKTGIAAKGQKFAGEFVFVGKGKVIQSWLIWPKKIKEIEIDSTKVPGIVLNFIRPDEGGLFSIIDYTNTLSFALHNGKYTVLRIQNPMKWQPNEIDGFYATEINGRLTLYPIEAKSKVTKDEINLDQLKGEFITLHKKFHAPDRDIQMIAAKMIDNGIDIALFPKDILPERPEKCIRIKFKPPIKNWL